MSSFSISPSINRLTGTPVQRLTTSAISSASTSSLRSLPLAWSCASAASPALDLLLEFDELAVLQFGGLVVVVRPLRLLDFDPGLIDLLAQLRNR